jgi:hypothetical protein
METTETEIAQHIDQNEAAKTISLILGGLPGMHSPNALFAVVNGNKVETQQIGEMNIERYSYCSALIAAGVKSSSQEVAVFNIGNILLIIAGIPKKLGEVCFSAIAQKQGLAAS